MRISKPGTLCVGEGRRGKAMQPIAPARRSVKRETLELQRKTRRSPWHFAAYSSALDALIQRPRSRCGVGDCVALLCVDEQRTFRCRIVPSTHAVPKKGRISCQSALGAQILGRRVGDKIKVEIFGRSLVFFLLEIKRTD